MKIYKIIISEPWDFKGPDGDDIILGEIIKEFNSTKLLFRAKKVQKFSTKEGKLFLFKARHYGEDIIHRDILSRVYYKGTFNATLLDDGDENSTEGEIAKKETIERFAFIGSIGYE